MNQALADDARMLVFANDTTITGGLSLNGLLSSITVLGVSTGSGQNAFAHMAAYNSNDTTLIPGSTISGAVRRIGMQYQTDVGSGLPRLWVFVLSILAGVILLIVLLSVFLNVALFMRRKSLRRRILSGEVNLELLGVKRLTVPQDVLDKIPVRIYMPGEQHFVNNTEAASSTRTKLKALKSKLTNKHSSEPVNTSQVDLVTPDAGAAGKPIAGYFQTDCPICLEDFETSVTQVRELPCKHIYHLECIDPFLKTRSSLCPLCKKSVLPTGYFPAGLRLTNATVRREREMRNRAAAAVAAVSSAASPSRMMRLQIRAAERMNPHAPESDDEENQIALRSRSQIEMEESRSPAFRQEAPILATNLPVHVQNERQKERLQRQLRGEPEPNAASLPTPVRFTHSESGIVMEEVTDPPVPPLIFVDGHGNGNVYPIQDAESNTIGFSNVDTPIHNRPDWPRRQVQVPVQLMYEDMALTEAEEAAVIAQRPSWRRVLQRIFPF